MHKNFKNIDKVTYGRGSFSQLAQTIEPVRAENNKYFVYVVDNYFNGKPLASKLQNRPEDLVYFIDVDPYEPTTKQIDKLRDEILAKKGVLTGPEKKLGLKCDWTVFNQVILDPELIESVPRDWWFYTGMDTYIHCIESESGIRNNAFSLAYGEQSLKLCREVYLGDKAGQTAENNDKLMVASLMGGLSLTYSEVGVCHAISYGLSKILGTRHCFANCVIFQHLGDIYPKGVSEFKQMIEKHKIELPQNISKEWTEETINAMTLVSYGLPFMWNHAFGDNYKEIATLDYIKGLFRRL